MQRYEEKGRANITLSHFLLVIDYQWFKVIEGNIINNKKREAVTCLSYSTPKKYLVDTDTILPRTTLSIS